MKIFWEMKMNKKEILYKTKYPGAEYLESINLVKYILDNIEFLPA